jgi:NAD(P)-dependent dehydrogenase (short-subunit alcohol dehydrogenase family)
MPNVRGVRLDVTSPADVAAAVELVRGSGRPLHGIVNISSISAFLSDSGTSAYTMSKARIAPR